MSKRAKERTDLPPMRRLIANGIPVYRQIVSAIYPVKSIALINATDLETGQSLRVVADGVLVSELRSNYPADSYVGKCFKIYKIKPRNGKRYATFSIAEVEPVNEIPAAQIAARM